MALTKVSVVYSQSQKAVRRVISSDTDDSHIDLHQQHMNPSDELWIDISLATWNTFTSHDDLMTYLVTAIGAATSDRCVVVDGTDMVVDVIKASPIIDDHPDGFLIQDDTVKKTLLDGSTVTIAATEIGEIYDFTKGAP